MLIDTHAHLYWNSFKKDFDEVIQRSLDAGVITIINVGVDVELSQKALQLESDKIKFFSTIGIHPHESANFTLSQIEELEEIYKSNPEKVVGVGECGLDYDGVENGEIKVLQKQLFQAQIDLAKKLVLPLVVHCRDDRSKDPENSEAWDEVLEMTGDHPTILHCYSGLPHITNHILQTTNFIVSFAGTLTYPKNDYLREACKLLPLEKIVVETDCPFLPPQSKRGTRNEPANVLEVALLIAKIKGISFEEVANQTTDNVKRLFAL